jgi:hypothetical protein
MRLWTLESGENIPGHELFSKWNVNSSFMVASFGYLHPCVSGCFATTDALFFSINFMLFLTPWQIVSCYTSTDGGRPNRRPQHETDFSILLFSVLAKKRRIFNSKVGKKTKLPWFSNHATH